MYVLVISMFYVELKTNPISSLCLQVSPDCKYTQTTVTFALGKETFSTTGKSLVSAGFTSVMHWQAISSDESMPSFKQGDVCPVQEVNEIGVETNKNILCGMVQGR